MKLSKRLEFFNKIKERSDEDYISRNTGRVAEGRWREGNWKRAATDTHKIDDAKSENYQSLEMYGRKSADILGPDQHHPFEKREPYTTDRLQKNIQVSANSPAEATDVNLSARVAKAIQAKMKGQSVPGESRWFLEEIGQYIPTGCVYLVGDPSTFTTFKCLFPEGVQVWRYTGVDTWSPMATNTLYNVANGLFCIKAISNSGSNKALSGFSGSFTDVIGDSRYLINCNAPESVEHVEANQFHYSDTGLFEGCTHLVSVSKDFLPCALHSTTTGDENATTYYQYAYKRMFKGCTSLKNVPDLPATILSMQCYSSMFEGCTSLEVAPALPSLALNQSNQGYQYLSMFKGCTSLTQAPALPATDLGGHCYELMFNGCTALTTSPALTAATSLKTNCYNSMFMGCTSLVNVGDVTSSSITSTAGSCFESMFENCISLESLPVFIHNKTTGSSHKNMFKGCTSLKSIPSDFTLSGSGSASANSFEGFFQGCTSLTSIPVGLLPDTTLNTAVYKNMFNGCTGITNIPDGLLPNAQALKESCYEGMFANTSITSFPTGKLNCGVLEKSCYKNMFSGTKITTVAEGVLPTGQISLAESCFEAMFADCTLLTSVPENMLYHTQLQKRCYANMFNGCINLTGAPYLPATTPGEDCYAFMFVGCEKLESIHCSLNSIINTTGVSDFTENANAYCTHKWVAKSSSTSTWGVKKGGNLYVSDAAYQNNIWTDSTTVSTCSGLPYLDKEQGGAERWHEIHP